MSKTATAKVEAMGRRKFLRMMGGCAAMAQTPALSTLLNLGLVRSAAAEIDPSGYKAMVCVFLFGGIDSYNVLVPIDGDASSGPYADYRNVRGSIALDRGLLHPIADNATGAAYGLHPGLSELQQLYNDGALGFVANTGALIEPAGDNSLYQNARLPLGLFSHSDQQRHWQTSTPQSRTEITGWAGRMSDILSDSSNSNPAVSMNISVGGMNILQTGSGTVPYAISADGAIVLDQYGTGYTASRRMLTQATDSLLNQTYADLFKQTFARFNRQAIDAAENYNLATGGTTLSAGVSDVLNATGLGRQLLQVAKAIGARDLLGQSRLVFFVALGGWDNHADLLNNQDRLLPELSSALKGFHDATLELGVASDVVTYTASDFARTLTPNTNNGSDHAWGGNHLIMGGGINGQRLFGRYPDSLAAGNRLDVGRGRLIPTTSVDEYAAELAMWFGVGNDGTLADILPNIRNFIAAGSAPPLGFFV